MQDETQNSVNPFAAHQALLRERLRLLLEPLHPALRPDVERALSEQGKLLAPPPAGSAPGVPVLPAGSWPLLTLLVAQHIGPSIDLAKAGNVAIAVECYVCALDILDDAEDEDQSPVMRDLGMARALNVSTALLALAQQAILSLRDGRVPSRLIVRLLQTLQVCTIDAVTGQHRDLLAEQRPLLDLTREECIEIAAGKAGAIMSLACRLGAMCAGATRRQYEQFARLGTALGIAHQLDNDTHDLYHLVHHMFSHATTTGISIESKKSDLARGKKTLPVVLAAKSMAKERGAEHAGMDAALKKLSELADSEKEEYRRLLHEGIVASWGICLLYRERAQQHLREIESDRPVASTLRVLLGMQ